MIEQEYLEKKGQITTLPQSMAVPDENKSLTAPDLDTYLAVLEILQRPKRHLTSPPTFIPRNFAEQIQFYDVGGVRRTYYYINGSWRYMALT